MPCTHLTVLLALHIAQATRVENELREDAQREHSVQAAEGKGVREAGFDLLRA
jgi:hypothetical protein